MHACTALSVISWPFRLSTVAARAASELVQSCCSAEQVALRHGSSKGTRGAHLRRRSGPDGCGTHTPRPACIYSAALTKAMAARLPDLPTVRTPGSAGPYRSALQQQHVPAQQGGTTCSQSGSVPSAFGTCRKHAAARGGSPTSGLLAVLVSERRCRKRTAAAEQRRDVRRRPPWRRKHAWLSTAQAPKGLCLAQRIRRTSLEKRF